MPDPRPAAAAAPSPAEETAIDPRAFRDAMGRFVTGVTVATTLDARERPVGVTVNSFTSVSLEPPLILFCLEKRARTRPAFEAAGRFAINVLSADQEELSSRFAKAPDDWTRVPSTVAATGAPLLVDALAALDCRTEAIHDGGDHVIMVGRVVRLVVSPGPGGAPLVYHRGRYSRLAEGRGG